MTPRGRLTSDPPRRTPTPSSSLRTFSRLWWGAPMAILFAVWMHGRRYGFGWSRLPSIEFLVILACSLVFIGWFGGGTFADIMQRFFRRDVEEGETRR